MPRWTLRRRLADPTLKWRTFHYNIEKRNDGATVKDSTSILSTSSSSSESSLTSLSIPTDDVERRLSEVVEWTPLAPPLTAGWVPLKAPLEDVSSEPREERSEEDKSMVEAPIYGREQPLGAETWKYFTITLGKTLIFRATISTSLFKVDPPSIIRHFRCLDNGWLTTLQLRLVKNR